MVERYEPELVGTREDYADMIVVDSGDYVSYSDYEALEARCRELEDESLKDGQKWLAEKFRADQTQAHAQKLFEALEITRSCLAKQLSSGHNQKGPSAEEIEKSFWAADEALSLAPMPALAAVRDEVREECAQIIEISAYVTDERGSRLERMGRPVDDVRTQAIAAAIRARKETGE